MGKVLDDVYRFTLVKNLKSFVFIFFLIATAFSHACGGHLSHHNHSCYFCSTVEDGESCKSVSPNSSKSLKRSCTEKEKYCMVVRLDYNFDGKGLKVWGIERNCSEECENGCIVLGERTKLYLCTSCCEGYLCNNDNGASNVLIKQQNILIISILFALLNLLEQTCFKI